MQLSITLQDAVVFAMHRIKEGACTATGYVLPNALGMHHVKESTTGSRSWRSVPAEQYELGN